MKIQNAVENMIATLNGHKGELIPEFGIDDIDHLDEDDAIHIGNGVIVSKSMLNSILSHPEVTKYANFRK